MNTHSIISQVAEICDHVVMADELPSAFNGGSLRAIFLGTDPGRTHETTDKARFQYVFCLEKGLESPYFMQFRKNLEEIRLTLQNLYVQNLCRNYFTLDTLDHRHHWLRCARLWLDSLKSELDTVDPSHRLPAFISAHILLKALTNGRCHEAEYYYRSGKFVGKSENALGRTLIPFFRGGAGKYDLSTDIWKDYKIQVTHAVQQDLV
jgi:hypothetical protein